MDKKEKKVMVEEGSSIDKAIEMLEQVIYEHFPKYKGLVNATEPAFYDTAQLMSFFGEGKGHGDYTKEQKFEAAFLQHTHNALMAMKLLQEGGEQANLSGIRKAARMVQLADRLENSLSEINNIFEEDMHGIRDLDPTKASQPVKDVFEQVRNFLALLLPKEENKIWDNAQAGKLDDMLTGVPTRLANRLKAHIGIFEKTLMQEVKPNEVALLQDLINGDDNTLNDNRPRFFERLAKGFTRGLNRLVEVFTGRTTVALANSSHEHPNINKTYEKLEEEKNKRRLEEAAERERKEQEAREKELEKQRKQEEKEQKAREKEEDKQRKQEEKRVKAAERKEKAEKLKQERREKREEKKEAFVGKAKEQIKKIKKKRLKPKRISDKEKETSEDVERRLAALRKDQKKGKKEKRQSVADVEGEWEKGSEEADRLETQIHKKFDEEIKIQHHAKNARLQHSGKPLDKDEESKAFRKLQDNMEKLGEGTAEERLETAKNLLSEMEQLAAMQKDALQGKKVKEQKVEKKSDRLQNLKKMAKSKSELKVEEPKVKRKGKRPFHFIAKRTKEIRDKQKQAIEERKASKGMKKSGGDEE